MEIICDYCGGKIRDPEMKTMVHGEYMMTYFDCPCGHRYAITVTDHKLRYGIRRYKKMVNRLKTTPSWSSSYERLQQDIALQKQANMDRSRKLRAKFASKIENDKF